MKTIISVTFCIFLKIIGIVLSLGGAFGGILSLAYIAMSTTSIILGLLESLGLLLLSIFIISCGMNIFVFADDWWERI